MFSEIKQTNKNGNAPKCVMNIFDYSFCIVHVVFSFLIYVRSPNVIALALCFFDDTLRHNVT